MDELGTDGVEQSRSGRAPGGRSPASRVTLERAARDDVFPVEDAPDEIAGAAAAPERSQGPGGWTIGLTILPAALAGLTYYVFVEYVLASGESLPTSSLWLLRTGGLAILALTIVLAWACGYVLYERFTRPLRLLLRLAESGEFPQGQVAFTHGRQWELFELYRRVAALVHQNQSGAHAVEELERTREAVSSLHRRLTRPGQHGLLAELPGESDDTLAEIVQPLAQGRARLVHFFADLEARLCAAREEMESMGRAAGWDRDLGEPPPDAEAGPGELSSDLPRARASLVRMRRVGTVLALESERLAGSNGHEVGGWFERFEQELTSVEATVEAVLAETRTRAVGAPGPPEGDAGGADQLLAQRWRDAVESLASIERRLREMEVR